MIPIHHGHRNSVASREILILMKSSFSFLAVHGRVFLDPGLLLVVSYPRKRAYAFPTLPIHLSIYGVEVNALSRVAFASRDNLAILRRTLVVVRKVQLMSSKCTRRCSAASPISCRPRYRSTPNGTGKRGGAL